MKHVINRHEQAAIDQLGAAADLLQQAIECFFGKPDLSHQPVHAALKNICQAIERWLEIDGWDENKKQAVRDYVEGGPRYSIERLWESLGVTIDFH